MHLEFVNELWYWRGPAPFHFITVPDAESAELRAISQAVSYGLGSGVVSEGRTVRRAGQGHRARG